jgi:SAM-dependent methyltransferase
MLKNFKSCSSEQTRDFYEGLTAGENKRGIWGMEARFDADAIGAKPSVQKHFAETIKDFMGPNDRCLDLGCGPGGFLALAAPFCREIVGVDIVPGFVKECQATIERHGIKNASTTLLQPGPLPFADASFDRVMMVDTIHHLEKPDETMAEVARVLKPSGLFLVFEPNKLNPLLALLCALDKNEHGLLRLGTFGTYEKLFKGKFVIEDKKYSGLLVGPEGKFSVKIADTLAGRACSVLGWLSPKIFMSARRV